MKTKKNKLGGVINSFNPTTPKNPTKALDFKPLIATSLALALGVSVAVATDPSISVDNSNQSVSTLTYKDAGDNYIQLQYSTTTPIRENLQFWIGDTNQTTFQPHSSISNRLDLQFALGNATFNGGSKGLKVGANGTGMLQISLWNATTAQQKTMTLDLSGATSEYALWGTLNVVGDQNSSKGANTFEGKFGGKGIKGNVTLNTVANSNLLFSNNNSGITGSLTIQNNGAITFKNLTSVTNGINLQGGTRTITFQDSGGATSSVPTLVSNINLSGGSTTISGLSTLQGNITARNTHNGGTIVFQGNSRIVGNIITSQNGGYDSIAIITATNDLTLGDGVNVYTIQSNAESYMQTKNLIKVTGSITFEQIGIIASNNTRWANKGNKINVLSASNARGAIDEITSAMNSTMAQNGDAQRVYNVLSLEETRNSYPQNLTINYINKKATVDSKGGFTGNNYIGKGFTSGSGSSLALNLNGTSWNDDTHKANVNLTISNGMFTNGGSTYINVNQITISSGGMTANGGSNQIAIAKTDNSINGNITATGGTNNLTSNGGSIAFKGNMTNNAGNNTLSASNGTITLSDSNTSVSFAVSGGGTATNTIRANIINAHGVSLSVVGNSNSTNKNIIESTDGTMSFATLSTSVNNTRGENKITNTNGSVAIDTISNGGGVNTVSASSGTITINTSISAIGGLTATNTLTANTLNISSATLSATGNGNSRNTNTLKANTGNITFSSITANNTSNNVNTITLGGGRLAIGGITSYGGKNVIKTTGTTTTSLTGNIDNNAGSNTLSITEGSINGTNSSSPLVIKAYGGGTATNTITADTLSTSNLSLVIEGNSNSTNTNTITTTSGTMNFATISTSVNNTRATNKVTNTSGNITITSVTSGGGVNTIEATNGTLTISNNISAIGGLTATNTLTANTLDITNATLSATGNKNSRNTNTLKATNGAMVFTSIKASDTSNNVNTITLDAGSFELTESMSASWGKNTITSGAITNTITGNISVANQGKNTLTFSNTSSTNTITADILASGGSNVIALSGTTNTITGNITASGGSNTITFSNAGGNKVEGVITTSAGTNNIAINGDSSNATSSTLTSNITNAGNTNIILESASWIPYLTSINTRTMNPNSGTLTNTAGSTNLAMRGLANTNSTLDSAPLYNINASGGVVNIAMEGNSVAVSNIDYGNGGVNLIFASSSNGTVSFSDTSIGENKILGKTYTDGVKLSLSDVNVAIQDSQKSLIGTFGEYFRNTNGALLNIGVQRTTDKDTININGLVAGKISSLANSQNQSSKSYEVTLNENSAFIGTLGIESSNISLTMKNNSKLIFAGDKTTAYTKIATLTLDKIDFDSTQTMNPIFEQTNSVINLATEVNDVYNAPTRSDFRLLEVGSKATQGTNQVNTGLVGNNALFQVYVNTNAGSSATLGGKTTEEWKATNNSNGGGTYGSQYSADRIIVHNVGDNSTPSTQHIQIVYDANTKIESIKYDPYGVGTSSASNIAVATVINTNSATGTGISDKGAVKFQLQNTLQGFDEIVSTLVGVYTDEYGMTGSNNTYTTYFIDNAKSAGASEANREATASALGVNYDLYMANFNSLNKRMGELRENDNSQGAWARIFNGSQTNTMGLGTKSAYTTFQGGYDYAFGFEGANNYLGVALAYGMSDSKTQSSMGDLNGEQRGVENIKSNAIEVAIYNSYVQDEGWYNDTIAKFSYIFSDFSMMGQSSTYSTTNMAFTLSDEFGYRFKLGNEKEWYIDPQLEVALGYFNQSDFVQTLGVASLQGNLDSIVTMRSRFGSSFGYDFKRFTEGKPIKASIYVGAFYEYDYLSGGDVTMVTNLGSTNSINSLSSDGRVVMNVGTNMIIKDNTRVYFDFEKSFAGKINTDYQVNVGIRYSFGEKTSYIPSDTNKKEVAPLKVSDEKVEDAQTTQESTKENTSNSQEQNNSTENKAQ